MSVLHLLSPGIRADVDEMNTLVSRCALVGPPVHAAALWLVWLSPQLPGGMSRHALVFGSVFWFIWPFWILSGFRQRAHLISLLLSFVLITPILFLVFVSVVWTGGGFAL